MLSNITDLLTGIHRFLASNVDLVVLPLLTLLVALVPIAKDWEEKQKRRPSKFDYLLCAILALLAWATYVSAASKLTEEQQQTAEAHKAYKTVEDAYAELTILYAAVQPLLHNQTLGNASAASQNSPGAQPGSNPALGILGPSPDQHTLATSEAAQKLINPLLTEANRQANQKIIVRLYPKEIDKETVLTALLSTLNKAGMTFSTGVGNANLSDHVTNSVRYGPNVPPDAWKLVSLALIRGGVVLHRIAEVADPQHAYKANVIEVLAEATADNDPAITLEQVMAMK